MFTIKFVLLLCLTSSIRTNLVPKFLSCDGKVDLINPAKPVEPPQDSLIDLLRDLSTPGKGILSIITNICERTRDGFLASNYVELINYIEYDAIREFFTCHAQELMKIVKAFNNRKMVLIIGEILYYSSIFGFHGDMIYFGKQPGSEYQKITTWVFTKFSQFISELLDAPFPNLNIEENKKLLNYRKETARIMLLILQQVDCSTFMIEFYKAGNRKISTRSYLQTMENYIDAIEADSLMGAGEIILQLRQMPENHSGLIPNEQPFQEKVLAQLLLWHYYSCRITDYEYENASVESLDPKFLAQLISTNYAINLSEIFSLFSGNQVIDMAITYIQSCKLYLLPSSLFEISQIDDIKYISHLINTKQDWKDNTGWLLKVYRKLFMEMKKNFNQ
jgi:hypothetical protein